MTTRRDFLRVGLATGLAAATTSLPALHALADVPAAPVYQHPKDPEHLTGLELAHWPKLDLTGAPATGKPFPLAIQIGRHIHPMTAPHHIEWVEVWAGDTRVQHLDFIEPTWAQPVVTVTLVRNAPTLLRVRLRCNLHGLWENTIQA